MRSPWLAVAAVYLVAVGVALHGWRFSIADEAAPAPALESATRRHVAFIAAAPRPVGSQFHDRVTSYLVQACRNAGADVTALTTASARAFPGGPTVAGLVTNVVATIPGRQHDRAVLAIAHYDSVPGSPGASDNAVSVGALLAVLEELRTRTPQNDVMFLFSDGEETGRLGAAAFLQGDQRASRVALVLNFDSRGSGGRPMLFETGSENGAAVSLFARFSRNPLATSVGGEIYRRMRNDTDFSPFRDASIPGLNVASIDGYARYHTVTDDVAHLESSSVRQRIDLVSHLVTASADADLVRMRAPAVTYFTVAGAGLVRYPLSWSFALALVSAALVIFALGRCARAGSVRPLHAVACAGAVLVAMLVTTLLCHLLWQALRPMADGRPLPQNGGYRGMPFLIGMMALAFAAAQVLSVVASRWARPVELVGGAAILTAALALVAARGAPGAAYVFTIPATAVGLSLLAGPGHPAPRWGWSFATWAASFFAVAVATVPLIDRVWVALGPAGLAAVSGSIVWLATLTRPTGWPGRQWRGPLAVLAAVAVVALAAGVHANRFNADRPRPDSVLSLTDLGARRTVRASTDADLDTYSSAWLGPARRHSLVTSYLPEIKRPLWTADVPFLGNGGLSISVFRPPSAGPNPLTRLDVRLDAPTDVIDLRFERGLRSAMLALGQAKISLPSRDGPAWVRIWVPGRGFSLEVETDNGRPMNLDVVGRTVEFRGGPNAPPARPPGFMPLPFGFDAGDVAATRTTLTF